MHEHAEANRSEEPTGSVSRRLTMVAEAMEAMRACSVARRRLLTLLSDAEDEPLIVTVFDRFDGAVAAFADASRALVALGEYDFEWQIATRQEDPIAALRFLLPAEATLQHAVLDAADPGTIRGLMEASDPVSFFASLRDEMRQRFVDVVTLDQMARGLVAETVPDDLSSL